MVARRVVVEFVAELGQFRRQTKSGADDLRKLRDEARQAQVEVAEMGRSSSRAATEVAQSAQRAAGQLRDARGRFASAGSEGGKAFGDSFTRDAAGKLRDARGRFVAEGTRLGSAAGSGVSRGMRGAVGDIASLVPTRPLILLAGAAGVASGALQSVPPVLSAIAGGLAAIPGLAAGAAGALATLSLGTLGIGDALGDVFNPPATGGGGGGRDRSAANARALESAERSLARAIRDEKLAQAEVSTARRQAARELRDLGIALGRIALDERDAALSVREAGEALAELRLQASLDPSSVSQTDLERAQLAYDQAIQAQTEVAARAQDLREDQAAAAKAGVEGSEQVQAALRRQVDAADAVLDATNAVTAAQEAMLAGAAGGGAAKAATAYDKLSVNAKKFVDEVTRLKPQLLGIQQLAQDKVFAGLDQELRVTAEQTLPFVERQVVRFGETWNQTFKQAFKVARDPEFQRGLDDAFGAVDGFMDDFNTRIPALGGAFGKLLSGSAPFIDRIGDKLIGYVDDFIDLVDRASQDGSMAEWFEDAADQAEALLDIGRELAIIVGEITGSQQGSTLLRDMADALHRYNEAGTQARDTAEVIEAGRAALQAMADVLATVGSALGEALADPGTREAVAAFFSVLGVGVEAVAGLATVFTALPDEVQKFLLVGAGVAVLANKLSGAFDAVSTKLGAANDRLRQTGPLGDRAARGLGRFGDAAGKAAGAFVALQVGAEVGRMFAEPAADAEKLAQSLRTLEGTGDVTGELARLWDRDVPIIRGHMQGLQADLALTRFGGAEFVRFAEDTLPGAAAVLEHSFGTSFTASQQHIDALDEALTRLAESGSPEEAKRQFEALARGTRLSLDDLPKFKEATEGVAAAQRLATQATEDFTRALEGHDDAVLNAMEAELSAAEAYDRAREAIERNGQAWDVNSEKGQENQRVIFALAREYNNATQAKLKETGSVEAANRVYEANRQKLYALALQATGSTAEAKKLTDQLLKVPNVRAAFETPGLATAVRLAREYDEMLSKIRRNVAAGGFGVNGNYLGVGGNRWGGLYEKAEVGLLRDATIYSARNPGRYMIAEPPTRGEAFIPKVGNPERSISIGRRAMEWYGHAVVPKSALTALRYGSHMAAPSGPSASDIAAAVGSVLAPALAAVASAGSGDVVVMLDSTEIARANRAGSRGLDRRG